MKDKNLPLDNSNNSLEDLILETNSIIESLEKEKGLKNSIETYQKLLKLNDVIQKKFHKNNKKISEDTKNRISKILLKKNEK